MKHKIKALGEVALRVKDLERMVSFYSEVVGLELMRQSETFAFFNIAPGFGGHTQVLAMFDRSESSDYEGLSSKRTTIDHFAFTLDRKDFVKEKERLLASGIELEYAYHEWVKWRSLYFNDPEGNRVEFVCYDTEKAP